MNQSAILIAAALAVGVGGGYLIGSNTAGGGDDPEQSSARQLGPRAGSASGSGFGGSDFRSGMRRLNSYDEIARLPSTGNRIQALIQFYGGLSVEQLEEEAGKLENLPMGERIMASILLFGQWGEKEPYSAMEYTNSMGMTGMFVKPTVLQSWASVDPANAAKYYDENPREFAMMDMGGRGRGMRGTSATGIIAAEWAKQDPDAALRWANSQERGKDDALASVIGEVAREDPMKAAGMLKDIDPEVAGRSYNSIAESYGAKDFAAAKSWIATLPADQQGSAMAAAIAGLARTDPSAAAAQVASMEAGDSKDRAVRNVIGSMANEDPKAAAEFLATNASADAQESSMRELIPAWVAKDPQEALNYTMSLEEGDVRDRALRSYLWSNSGAEVSENIQVAESISSERDRNRTIGWMTSRWMRDDPDAAKAYVESTTALSDEVKERILNRGDDRD
ncbi:MAG: hypothetical protein R3242_10580 [Akkermansiaceae bacterium]|nr:hypothetical protein [Akkermansiaceae bacterium]